MTRLKVQKLRTNASRTASNIISVRGTNACRTECELSTARVGTDAHGYPVIVQPLSDDFSACSLTVKIKHGASPIESR
jgi:hypothetical protein